MAIVFIVVIVCHIGCRGLGVNARDAPFCSRGPCMLCHPTLGVGADSKGESL